MGRGLMFLERSRDYGLRSWTEMRQGRGSGCQYCLFLSVIASLYRRHPDLIHMWCESYVSRIRVAPDAAKSKSQLTVAAAQKQMTQSQAV